jgi:C-terminal processing protease CtpA/Prc
LSELSIDQRRAVLEKTLRLIEHKLMGPEVDTVTLRDRHKDHVLSAGTSEAFEQAMTELLRDLGVSHTGFFNEAVPRTAGRVAIAATFLRAETPDGPRWMFQDVHPGGAAAGAGLVPGDTLLAIDGVEIVPPQAVPFVLGQQYRLTVRRADDSTTTVAVDVPRPKDKKHPVVVPDQVVTTRSLADGVGLMKVSMFPGVLGMDVAKDMSRALAELSRDRVIVDLRGNTGGGIGCLRLMSLLCPDRRGVGYTVSRDAIKHGYTKEQLPVFDHIPASKLGVVPLALRFARGSRSVAVFTEALGQRPWHGRIVILLNEHSASASEMVAAFAKENGLATLVGTKTPGRLVGTSAFKVGSGYRVALPVAGYRTWKGTDLEGKGVEPDISVVASAESLRRGSDVQLHAAALAAVQQSDKVTA